MQSREVLNMSCRVGGPLPYRSGRDEFGDRAGEAVPQGTFGGSGLSQHRAVRVGVEGAEEEGQLAAVGRSQSVAVPGRDVVERIDVRRVAPSRMVVGDLECTG